MTDQWERQKKELDSYNLFYSAIKGNGRGQGLLDLGYKSVGNFMRIPDNRNGAELYPDVVLYNNESLLLVEMKSGNSVEPRDKEQMKEADRISIQAGRDFLKRADLRDPLLDPSELTDVQPLIVYYRDTISSCQDSANCMNRLSEMGTHGGILSQEKGGELNYVEGSISNSALNSTLDYGIALPRVSETVVYLTDGIEREILASSICHDMIRSEFATRDEVTIEIDDVQDYYDGRSVKRGRTRDALEFLSISDICSRNHDQSYTFRESNVDNLMAVNEKLSEERVSDWLDRGTSRQSSFGQFER